MRFAQIPLIGLALSIPLGAGCGLEMFGFPPLGEGEGEDIVDANPISGADALQVVSEGHIDLGTVTWVGSSSRVLFADGWLDTIWALDSGQTAPTIFRESGGMPSGIRSAANDSLLVAEADGRRVTSTAADGTYNIIADAIDGVRFNSPSDIDQRSDGTIYFSDPYLNGTAERNLTYQGIFRVDAAGIVTLQNSDMLSPIGLAFSPDETILYVTDNEASLVNSFPINPDGTLGSPSPFRRDLSGAQGIVCDDAGNVYVAAADGVHVMAADGNEWGIVAVPEQPTNLAFGGPERRTLWVTGSTTLYKVDLSVAGRL